MQDPPFPFPSCFAAGERLSEDPTTAGAKSAGQSVVTSVYRTKIAGHCRLITVSWCKNVLARGLSVSVDDEAPSGSGAAALGRAISLKVEMRPWHFWRKHGARRFQVDGRAVDVAWDLRSAKFGGEPEPQSGFYVAVAGDREVALLLGDGKREAYRKTGCRPASIDAALLSREEHVFGRAGRFATRARFQEKGGRPHEVAIEYSSSSSGCSIGGNIDPEMVIKIDGAVAVHVKHLQWKFRGNECITVSRARVEVYWDVHDWLFSPGLSHAMFIFKPISLLTSSSMPLSSSDHHNIAAGSSGFSLFLYAWKLD
ncbi:hypothetical protein Cni_G11172 [Canna indica]|uniref:DUF868 family protein n=1 Tax=Canna indica TaxID=4628 RepID=A0AAQ3K855_9LILI|nr:hypothetical protein Cni_G11172 [Canna indica]